MSTAAKILLVEDDDDLRDMLQTVLVLHGYSVTAAPTGNLAMSLLGSQQFDLVLLDIILPDGNGFRVAELIRANKLPSKVIVMTGSADTENAAKGAALGVQDYIPKPFRPQNLLKSIEHALSIEV